LNLHSASRVHLFNNVNTNKLFLENTRVVVLPLRHTLLNNYTNPALLNSSYLKDFYGPFCHDALKLDMSTLYTTFFLCASLQFILYIGGNEQEFICSLDALDHGRVFGCLVCLSADINVNAMVTNKTDIVRFHRFAHHRRI